MAKAPKNTIPYAAGTEIKDKQVYIDYFLDGTYTTRYVVLICNKVSDGAELIREITGIGFDNMGEGTKAFASERFDQTGAHHVFLVYTPRSSFHAIVHEIIHAVNFVYQWHGVKLDPENDEPQAYMTGNIGQKVYDIFQVVIKKQLEKKWNKKRK